LRSHDVFRIHGGSSSMKYALMVSQHVSLFHPETN
jgi:hypothetical protein